MCIVRPLLPLLRLLLLLLSLLGVVVVVVVPCTSYCLCFAPLIVCFGVVFLFLDLVLHSLPFLSLSPLSARSFAAPSFSRCLPLFFHTHSRYIYKLMCTRLEGVVDSSAIKALHVRLIDKPFAASVKVKAEGIYRHAPGAPPS